MREPINAQQIEEHPVVAGEIKVYLVWFDSYGAKSSCVLIETPDLDLLVDPGASGMQPSYPLTEEERAALHQHALDTIVSFSHRADTVFISHYHYDHHTPPSHCDLLYRGKELWIKDPNRWVNQSQWKRARLFFTELYEVYGGTDRGERFVQPEDSSQYNDPLQHLPIAMSKDYGDYQTRKNQLLQKGQSWFRKLVELWQREPWLSACRFNDVSVQIADGQSFRRRSTLVRFTEPMFHGIEYDRVGWVVGLTLEHGSNKVIYASDLQGPSIEDYAHWIIDENPDILILDGPATYLFGYMINRINLQRAIDNVCTILSKTSTNVIIYDHHNLREHRYRERLAQAYATASATGKTFVTAAEWLGHRPLIDIIAEEKNSHA